VVKISKVATPPFFAHGQFGKLWSSTIARRRAEPKQGSWLNNPERLQTGKDCVVVPFSRSAVLREANHNPAWQSGLATRLGNSAWQRGLATRLGNAAWQRGLATFLFGVAQTTKLPDSSARMLRIFNRPFPLT
jgi:hypothetical protein